MLPLTHYLFLSCALLFIGLIGVLTRRNPIIRLFSMEIILNATLPGKFLPCLRL